MVKTPPYQKRGKCGHFMPQFDSHGSCFGCRAKCKGLDPCAQGADTTQCSACASPTEEQWSHLRENFAKRSAYRHKTGSQGDSFEEPETEEAALTGEDFSRVDDTLLDLEPEDSGTSAPLTGISPLTSLPASLPTQSVPATSFTMGPIQQSTTDSSALFRAPHPLSQTVTQDIPPSGYLPHTTPGRQSVAERMAALSFPQPQRAVSTTEIPQTPRTQLIRSQLEQQNFEMMNSAAEKPATNQGCLCSVANRTAGIPSTVHGADVHVFGPGTNSTSSSYIYNTATSYCVNHTGVCHTACQSRGTNGLGSISTCPS